MRLGKLLVAGAALVAVSTSAEAFQEQQGSSSGATQQVVPNTASAKPDVGFSSGDASKGEVKGTEVRIPGLGKLGVLPKMDFGLELLYGAAQEPKADSARPDTTREDEDLRIRGTVKHRF